MVCLNPEFLIMRQRENKDDGVAVVELLFCHGEQSHVMIFSSLFSEIPTRVFDCG